MGTPLPPNSSGFRCPICWGSGKTFGFTETPRVMQMRLTALNPGEHSNSEIEQNLLVTHYLIQQADPCRWEIIDGTFLWFLEWAPTATLVAVRALISLRFAFAAIVPTICQLDVASDIISPVGSIAWGGFANFTWDLEGLD